MKSNQLKELQRIIGGETSYPGKVVGIENGITLVATAKGIQRSRVFAEIGSRVTMRDGEIERMTGTEKMPQFRV